MIDQHIVLFAFAIFWASVDAQDYTVRPESGYRRANEDIELVWEFDLGTGSFLGGQWWNTEGVPVMRKTGSDNTTVTSGFEHKFEPIEEYGMKILNFTEMDNGIYTCRIVYLQSTVKNLDDLVNISASTIEGDALSTPNLIVAFRNEEFVVTENFTLLAFGVLTTLTTYAPVNNPPLVDAVISVSGVSEQRTETCFRMSDENCTVEYEPNENFTVTVTLSHPLVDSANVTWIMTVEDLPMCQSCKNGGTCNQATLKCICPDGFTGVTCEIDPQEDKCKWWCILIIVLVVVSVVVIIICCCCCCWHYKVACFAHKCCPWSSNHSRPSTAACSKVDVNDVERTVTTGSHGNKQDAGNKDSPYRDVHRPDGHMSQKGDGSHGLQVPQGVPVTNSDQKRPMPSPGLKTVLPPLEDPERSKKKKNRKSREEE